ncbi:MAG TPA: hypothetical protein VL634_11700 [Mycobacterium sp.]|nr:hypothetical protein [Mycobacterium sp.]
MRFDVRAAHRANQTQQLAFLGRLLVARAKRLPHLLRQRCGDGAVSGGERLEQWRFDTRQPAVLMESVSGHTHQKLDVSRRVPAQERLISIADHKLAGPQSSNSIVEEYERFSCQDELQDDGVCRTLLDHFGVALDHDRLRGRDVCYMGMSQLQIDCRRFEFSRLHRSTPQIRERIRKVLLPRGDALFGRKSGGAEVGGAHRFGHRSTPSPRGRYREVTRHCGLRQL